MAAGVVQNVGNQEEVERMEPYRILYFNTAYRALTGICDETCAAVWLCHYLGNSGDGKRR